MSAEMTCLELQQYPKQAEGIQVSTESKQQPENVPTKAQLPPQKIDALVPEDVIIVYGGLTWFCSDVPRLMLG